MPDVAEINFSSNGFDILSRLQTQLGVLENRVNNVGAGTDKFGEGFLRGETRVARSAGNMVQGLLQVNSAADAAALALTAFERSTILGLGLALGLAVGVKAFEAIHKQIEEVDKARTKLEDDMGTPIGLVVDLAPADIHARIVQVDKDIDDLQKKREKLGPRFVQAFRQADADNIGAEGRDVPAVKDKSMESIISARKYQHDQMEAEADAELKVVEAKRQGLEVSEAAGKAAKIELDYATARAKLFSGAFKPGASQEVLFKRFAAIEETRSTDEDQLTKSEALKSIELDAAEQIANFRGTAYEAEQNSLQVTLEKLEAEKRLLDAYGNEDEQKKKQLEIDKQEQAIFQRKVEIASQAATLNLTDKEVAIRVGTAQASVGLGPEDSQQASLQSQVELTKLAADEAIRRFDADSDNLKLNEAMVKAIGAQEIAVATLAKFERERAFAHEQQMNAAHAATTELVLNATGQADISNLVKMEADYRGKIAQAIHDGNDALAAELQLQQRISEISQRANYLAKSPQQINEDSLNAIDKQRLYDTGRRQLEDEADRAARGAYGRSGGAPGFDPLAAAGYTDAHRDMSGFVESATNLATGMREFAKTSPGLTAALNNVGINPPSGGPSVQGGQAPKTEQQFKDQFDPGQASQDLKDLKNNQGVDLGDPSETFKNLFGNGADSLAANLAQAVQDEINAPPDLSPNAAPPSDTAPGEGDTSLADASDSAATNLQTLADMDFSGLSSLDGLTIQIG